jgi:hypothetical protein
VNRFVEVELTCREVTFVFWYVEVQLYQHVA